MWNIDVLARTIWGEARGEGRGGMEAVASVVMNRYRSEAWYTAPSVAGVAMKRLQFSAWNTSDPNYTAMINVDESDPAFELARKIAIEAISGALADQTGGATHYHANSITAPVWTQGATRTAQIGKHLFYIGVA